MWIMDDFGGGLRRTRAGNDRLRLESRKRLTIIITLIRILNTLIISARVYKGAKVGAVRVVKVSSIV